MFKLFTFTLIAFTLRLWVLKIVPRFDSFEKVHLCLLNVNFEHCGDPWDWIKEPQAQIITKNEVDKANLIKKFKEVDFSIFVSTDCKIGVGYNTCIDVNFRAADLFKRLDLQKLGQIVPQTHQKISTLKEFVETFLDHFRNGRNGEYVSNSKELFSMLYNEIKADAYSEEIGGHSAVWALTS